MPPGLPFPAVTRTTMGCIISEKMDGQYQPADRLVVYVSGDNRYKLFVNGHWFRSGPAGAIYSTGILKQWTCPLISDRVTMYRAAVVWNFGEDRAEGNLISYQLLLSLQADEQAWSTLNTGTSWRCMTDSATSRWHPS